MSWQLDGFTRSLSSSNNLPDGAVWAADLVDAPSRLRGAITAMLSGVAVVADLSTALDLVANGFRVYAAVDAIGSRHAIDYDIALRRMELAGVTLTTTEAALFEWCGQSATPEFKQISALVRESAPSS